MVPCYVWQRHLTLCKDEHARENAWEVGAGLTVRNLCSEIKRKAFRHALTEPR